MIANQGRGRMARLYEVEGGSHFEDRYGQHPDLLRPMLPCFRDAFEALEKWTQDGKTPPTSHMVRRDARPIWSTPATSDASIHRTRLNR